MNEPSDIFKNEYIVSASSCMKIAQSGSYILVKLQSMNLVFKMQQNFCPWELLELIQNF